MRRTWQKVKEKVVIVARISKRRKSGRKKRSTMTNKMSKVVAEAVLQERVRQYVGVAE